MLAMPVKLSLFCAVWSIIQSFDGFWVRRQRPYRWRQVAPLRAGERWIGF